MRIWLMNYTVMYRIVLPRLAVFRSSLRLMLAWDALKMTPMIYDMISIYAETKIVILSDWNG